MFAPRLLLLVATVTSDRGDPQSLPDNNRGLHVDPRGFFVGKRLTPPHRHVAPRLADHRHDAATSRHNSPTNKKHLQQASASIAAGKIQFMSEQQSLPGEEQDFADDQNKNTSLDTRLAQHTVPLTTDESMITPREGRKPLSLDESLTAPNLNDVATPESGHPSGAQASASARVPPDQKTDSASTAEQHDAKSNSDNIREQDDDSSDSDDSDGPGVPGIEPPPDYWEWSAPGESKMDRSEKIAISMYASKDSNAQDKHAPKRLAQQNAKVPQKKQHDSQEKASDKPNRHVANQDEKTDANEGSATQHAQAEDKD